MLNSKVLTFGDFITKSGRHTPYFINTGKYNSGSLITRLGRFYADFLVEYFGDNFNVLFGPAYKGIPIVVATAIALHNKYNRDVKICFNRKEAKDHGEKGVLVGYTPKKGDKVVILEDVTTAGTSIRETVPILNAIEGVEIEGVLVSVDRMEKGKTEKSALKELAEEFGFQTYSIVSLDDIVRALENYEVDGKPLLDPALKMKIEEYRRKYGAKQ